MFNLLQVIDLGPSAADGAMAGLQALLTDAGPKLPGVRSAVAGRTLPRALNGGHILWRLAFGTESDYWSCIASPAWRSEITTALAPDRGVLVDTIAYQAELFQTSRPGDPVGIWRCLVLAVEPGASAPDRAQFERDLLLMPDHVTTIRSWALGRAKSSSGRRGWTHVWEQEFRDLAGLEGEYMTSPIHWGLVDGWFDPECPQRIVDPHLIHAAIAISEPVLGRSASR